MAYGKSVLSMSVGLLFAVYALASEPETCAGPFNHGGRPSVEALAQILQTHAQWRPDPTASGAQRANLCGADLRGMRLSRARLAQSNLRGALLTETFLEETDLRGADLRQADLRMAIMGGANLQEADLGQADLRQAYLADANLRGVTLRGSNLRGAILIGANLTQAHLEEADLRRATVRHANLRGSRLFRTNLQETDLWGVNLTDALLVDTKLLRANLRGANLAAAVFEPHQGMLPPGQSFAFVRSLAQVTFASSPHALVELRQSFQRLGMHQQERTVTFAINRALRQQAPLLKNVFSLLFFELTCQYGMSPGRPLVLVILLTLCCAIPYTMTLPASADERQNADETWWEAAQRWIVLCLIGLYVSCLSAVAQRGCSAGQHAHPWHVREYPRSATRWLRWLSTLQCLITVYLLVLWILITFARPFA